MDHRMYPVGSEFIEYPPVEFNTSGDIGTDVAFAILNSKNSAIHMVIEAPTPGRFLMISQKDTGSSGHTVSLNYGEFVSNVDTVEFNAKDETLVLFGISTRRFVIVENIGSVDVSGVESPSDSPSESPSDSASESPSLSPSESPSESPSSS